MPDFRLDRFTPADEPSQRKRQLWQRSCEKIEEAFTNQQTQITQIADLQATQADIISDLADQLAQIIAAQAAADAAQADAVAAARETARLNSYPNPGVGILSAADAGTDATITVAGHTRVYPVQGSIDVPDVAITGSSITGLAYSTKYWVYYDDTTLAVTAPTFIATTSSATAQVGAAAGRHALGFITTPASGGGSTSGDGGAPPGGGGGGGLGAIP